LVGIGAAGSFGTQLSLYELIELAVDAGDADAGAGIACQRLDLVAPLGDIAGRLRVCDIRRHDRKRCLVRTQTGHRNGES